MSSRDPAPARLALAATGCAFLILGCPALACDLDGFPGMPGSHRFNPFAARGAAVPGIKVARPDTRSPQATPPDREEGRDDAPLDQRPRRERDSRDGSGPISEAGKATFP